MKETIISIAKLLPLWMASGVVVEFAALCAYNRDSWHMVLHIAFGITEFCAAWLFMSASIERIDCRMHPPYC